MREGDRKRERRREGGRRDRHKQNLNYKNEVNFLR